MQKMANSFPSKNSKGRGNWQGDPLADDAVSKIIGPWNRNSSAENSLQWANLKSVIQHFPENLRNEQVLTWEAPDTYLDTHAKGTLQQYIQTAGRLPAWADVEKIEIASDLFMKNGALSSVILFCSSLPECYLYPSISALLQSSGNLENQTAYRIRSTATMVFPVMLSGGLTSRDGQGILPIVKSRFVHAIIRNLILRGNPAERCQMNEEKVIFPDGPLIDRITDSGGESDAFKSIFLCGWDLRQFGIPCNQEEQAYVLLCFSHIFLRGMHKMGVKLRSSQEEAFLHAWNVIGDVLGIETRLMASTQSEAAALLARIQSEGSGSQDRNPGQPSLTNALVQTMENALPWTMLKPLPTLMVRHLSTPQSAEVLPRKETRYPLTESLFSVTLFFATQFDKLTTYLKIQFSIMQTVIHILGKRFVIEILKMDPNAMHQKIENGHLNKVRIK